MQNPWTPPPTHKTITPQGNQITYCLYGPPKGTPIISLLGAPSSRWERPDMINLYEQHNLRVLIPDRPGYGGSTRQPRRKIADIVPIIETLANAQQWKKFAITGHSAGAPHALACAALLPTRITKCAIVASPAPPDTTELDFTGKDRPGRAEAFTIAPQGEQALRPYLEQRVREAIAAWPKDMDEGARQRTRAAYDSLDGCIDDDIALVNPWNFDPTTIQTPVGIWYSTTDPNMPTSHATWLKTNIKSEPHEYKGGHDPDEKTTEEILTWLKTQPQEPEPEQQPTQKQPPSPPTPR